MFMDFIKSPLGRIIISIVWGLGLSTLFKRACENRTCQIIQYEGPDPQEISNSVYQYGTPECYQYRPRPAKCATDQKESIKKI